jgi:carboxyl-terminal processing protease
MKRYLLWLFAFLLVAPIYASVFSDTTLVSKPIFGKQAKVVVYLLDNNHYSKLRLNDSLSSAILDSYISQLDNNRSYFLDSDIKSFEKYRTRLDDLIQDENIDPAFEIYSVFVKRYSERMDYVLNELVTRSFDFTKDEYYDTERDNSPWLKSIEEQNQLWEKIIKSQVLSLKLAGKDQVEITETLKKRYERFVKSMDKANGEDVFNIYMNAVTNSYDPYTDYFSPKLAEQFRQSMSLSLEGIGARLSLDNDYTKVVEILPGGPAEKTKLVKVNDRIIGVAQGDEGEMVDVVGWRIEDVVSLIKGPKGTKVRLQLLPAETGVTGPSKEIELIRDKIKLEDLSAKKEVIDYQTGGKSMKLGVITLPSFYRDFEAYQNNDPNYKSASRDVKRFIEELKTQGVDGIALDLRNNGGGSLDEAIELTGLFIKNGPVVQVKNSINQIEVREDEDKSVLYDGPLVVLINRFSASASEIFAAAIQDYKRGVIVGESSFGKGTVQMQVDLHRFLPRVKEEVGQMKLTFQKFYRVTGSSTQRKGVMPDVEFPTALAPEQFGESSQPSSLPWDEIRGTLYQRTPLVNDRVLANLNNSYKRRLSQDPALNRYVTETEEARRNLSQTRISLNEAKRRQEITEAEKRKASNDKMGGITVDKEGQEGEPLTMEDEFLREGLLVLSDLITSRIG